MHAAVRDHLRAGADGRRDDEIAAARIEALPRAHRLVLHQRRNAGLGALRRPPAPTRHRLRSAAGKARARAARAPPTATPPRRSRRRVPPGSMPARRTASITARISSSCGSLPSAVRSRHTPVRWKKSGALATRPVSSSRIAPGSVEPDPHLDQAHLPETNIDGRRCVRRHPLASSSSVLMRSVRTRCENLSAPANRKDPRLRVQRARVRCGMDAQCTGLISPPHASDRLRFEGILRPVVLRIPAPQVLAHLGVRAAPEARQIARHLHRPLRRGEQLEGDRHPARRRSAASPSRPKTSCRRTATAGALSSR